jgi:hypothetical protein
MTSKDSNPIEGVYEVNGRKFTFTAENVNTQTDGLVILSGARLADDSVEPTNPCRETVYNLQFEGCDLSKLTTQKGFVNALYGLGIRVPKDMEAMIYGEAVHKAFDSVECDPTCPGCVEEMSTKFDTLITDLVHLGEVLFGTSLTEGDLNEERTSLEDRSEYAPDSFEYAICEALDMCEETLLSDRVPQYKRQPASYVDMETMLHQLKLKVIRAGEAISEEKQIDEMKDTANYAILMLARMIKGDFL